MAKILNISGTEITDIGIQKLAEYVKANMSDDFTLVIGCKPSIYDVDAILIGKGNIYAIECKDWKGKISGHSYGWWQQDGQMMENPLQQARNNAVALGKWLRKKLNIQSKNLWVNGLVVFTHIDSKLLVHIDDDSNVGTSVTLLHNLRDWTEKKKPSFDTKLIRIVNDWFYDLKGKDISGFSCDIDNKLQNRLNFELKAIYITFFILSITAIFFYGLESLIYIGIVALFFFLFIKPSIRRLQKKATLYQFSGQSNIELNKIDKIDKPMNSDYESDVVRDPAYRDIPGNIWHREAKK